MMMLGIQSELLRGKNTSWFEGDFYPVVGTSLLLEIDPEASNHPLVVGKSHDQFNLARKFYGSSAKFQELNSHSLLNPQYLPP